MGDGSGASAARPSDGQLVGGQADAVARAVPEVRPVAGRRDDVARGRVDGPVRDRARRPRAPGASSSKAAALGLRHQLVDGEVARGGSPTNSVRVMSER